jgi:regulator of replication initiation timing
MLLEDDGVDTLRVSLHLDDIEDEFAALSAHVETLERENARLTAENKTLADELTDWVLMADGIKHNIHCRNHFAGDPNDQVCDRCRAEQAEQQRDAAHAALEKFGGHAEMCPRSARVVHCRLVADPDDVDDFITKRFYSRSEQPCTCGFDAALAASAPQKEQK